jgi:hypothetical protein
MFRSRAQINELEREHWCEVRARGKTRFVWREATLAILIWLVALPAVQIFEYHGHLLSRQFLTVWFLLLPISLLGGYLGGIWKWQDLQKKFPESL